MKKLSLTIPAIILSAILISGCGKKQQEKIPNNEVVGEFAPPDAYINDSKHPYYGSENDWNDRFFTRDPRVFYKRRGQKAMLLIVNGKAGEAEKYCRELLSKDSQDLEAMFNLTAALAQQNKIDEAVKEMEHSIEMGLPFGRYLAGPRDILRPLTNSKGFKEYASLFNMEILHGPMVGRVSDQEASFWVRTYHLDKIQVRLSNNENMTYPVYSEVVTSDPAKDYTAIVKAQGLKPSTLYFYEVLVNGKTSPQTVTHNFRTYPKADRSSSFKVAFGGCAGYVPWNERIWRVIKDHNPIAFLWLGDNVYINMPYMPQGGLYYTYYRRQSRPEFREMVSSMANYAVWDDHDAATDDVWLGPYKDKPVWKMPLLKVFEENWINPEYGTKEWPATFNSFSIADVDFFMLDDRTYRTDPYAPDPTILGPAQDEWLMNGLKNSKAVFKVIVSGVPWAYDAKPGAKDTWNGFHQERDKIFNFLTDHHISGVVLLSGDRHRTDIRKIERPGDYTLYDWENSRLTNQHVAPLEPGAIFQYNQKQSFGILNFDTFKKNPEVTYEVYSIDNELLHTMTLTLNQLTSKN